jgi:hypothetical protein
LYFVQLVQHEATSGPLRTPQTSGLPELLALDAELALLAPDAPLDVVLDAEPPHMLVIETQSWAG